MAEVENLVRRIAPELGVQVLEKAGYLQLKAANGHRVNIQRSKTLGHIDTTLDVLGQEGTLPLKNGPGSNGAIMARIEPTLELLERYMRMLPGAGAVKKAAGPRPFSVRQAVAPRKPTALTEATPVPAKEGQYAGKPAELAERLETIAKRHRAAKVRRYVEEGIDQATAEAIVDGKIDPSDVIVQDETRGLINNDGVVEVEQ